jgi:hypothetical protein
VSANGTRPETDFPFARLRDALPHLRRPFAPSAVGFKPQQKNQRSTLCVGYIDARVVTERLNTVVGGEWQASFEKADDLGAGLMWCHLRVCDVTRSDVGEGKGKGLVSDSLKRAAVHFGVGRSLYALPPMFLDGSVDRLTNNHRAELRSRYERWLEQEGIEAFGQVLDHGDASVGSTGVALEQETLDIPDPTEEDELAVLEALIDQAEFKPGKKKAMLDAARESGDTRREMIDSTRAAIEEKQKEPAPA